MAACGSTTRPTVVETSTPFCTAEILDALNESGRPWDCEGSPPAPSLLRSERMLVHVNLSHCFPPASVARALLPYPSEVVQSNARFVLRYHAEESERLERWRPATERQGAEEPAPTLSSPDDTTPGVLP